MKLNTTRFGEIEVVNELVFNFISPIIGFNELKKFMLIEHNEKSCFKWLQSLEDPSIAFPITTASFFSIDYQFEISDEDAKTLDLKSSEELLVINIANIPAKNPHKATLNLRAPIIINTTNLKAMQLIIQDEKYEIKHPLFEKKEMATATKKDKSC